MTKEMNIAIVIPDDKPHLADGFKAALAVMETPEYAEFRELTKRGATLKEICEWADAAPDKKSKRIRKELRYSVAYSNNGAIPFFSEEPTSQTDQTASALFDKLNKKFDALIAEGGPEFADLLKKR